MRKMVKSKKGDVPAQITSYILAAILFGLIMVFGYNVIVSMRESSAQVNMVKFKTDIEGYVKKMSLEQGRTVGTFESPSPGNFNKICFADSAWIEEGNSFADVIGTQSTCKGIDLISGSMKDKIPSNMFFFPGGANFEIGQIEVPNGCACFPIAGGRVTVRMRGKGDKARIES